MPGRQICSDGQCRAQCSPARSPHIIVGQVYTLTHAVHCSVQLQVFAKGSILTTICTRQKLSPGIDITSNPIAGSEPALQRSSRGSWVLHCKHVANCKQQRVQVHSSKTPEAIDVSWGVNQTHPWGPNNRTHWPASRLWHGVTVVAVVIAQHQHTGMPKMVLTI